MALKAVIDPEMCDGAPTCIVKRVCPKKAVFQKGIFGGVAEVNEEKCIGCGLCIKYCPHKAVLMVEK